MKLLFLLTCSVLLMACEMTGTQNKESETAKSSVPVSNQPVKQEQKTSEKVVVQQQKNVQKNVASPKVFRFKKVKINAEDPLEYALNVYEENRDAPEGVYINDGLVIVVACVPLDDESSTFDPEGRAMLAEIKLLRKKFNLLEKITFNRENLENGENDDGTIYRLVTAYRLADIENALKNRNVEVRSLDNATPVPEQKKATDKGAPTSARTESEKTVPEQKSTNDNATPVSEQKEATDKDTPAEDIKTLPKKEAAKP